MNNLFDQSNTSIIKVIGVGGGGSNAVSYMYKQGIHGVDFAVCNTDKQALDVNPVNNKVQLGPDHTEGLGAGSIPEVGRQACIESLDDVRRFLEKETKMLFITAGMGGGTGTGAAPIIAKLAKEMGILTVAIVTLPFKFEGLRRKSQALEGIDDLKKNVDSLLVISNERVKELYGNLRISEAFSKADDILATAARGIAEIITLPGYVNVDFKDVNTVMKNSGVSIMGYGEASGVDRARKAIEMAVNSPLLEDNDIRGAQHILLNISSGAEEVTMDEISEITEYIAEEAGNGTDMIWGNCTDDNLGDKITVTLIATCFKRVAEVDAPPKRVGIDDLDINEVTKGAEVFDIKEKPVNNVIEFDATYNPNTSSTPSEPFIKDSQKEEQTPNTYTPRPVRPQRVVRNRSQEGTSSARPINSPQDVNEMESIPAYKRKRITLEDRENNDMKGVSKLSINLDDLDNPRIERNNSFFHNNVD